MPGVARANLFIRRRYGLASGVATFDVTHALQLFKDRFDTPEATTTERRQFSSHRASQYEPGITEMIRWPIRLRSRSVGVWRLLRRRALRQLACWRRHSRREALNWRLLLRARWGKLSRLWILARWRELPRRVCARR